MSVGKKAGKSIYVHASAIYRLRIKEQTRVVNALMRLPYDFKHNFVIIHPKYVAFVVAEDFNEVYEPVLGERYKVYEDTSKGVIYEPRAEKPKILHQRYKTVTDTYTGFDIEDDKKREQWYREHFDAKAMAGAGYKHNWEKMLERI